MLIGELARRTATSERQLRHYERTGLLTASRLGNGYRDYPADAPDQVARIRALLSAGLPTRVIAQVLPCTDGTGTPAACPGVLDVLHTRLAELDRRAADLDVARNLLRTTIARTTPLTA